MEDRRNTVSLQETRKLRMMYLALKTHFMDSWPIPTRMSHYETCTICRRMINSIIAQREANKVRLPGDNDFLADKMNNAASGQPIRGHDRSSTNLKSLTLQEKVNRRLKYFTSNWEPSPLKPDRKCVQIMRYPIIQKMQENNKAVWKEIEKCMRLQGKSLQETRKERLKYFSSKGQLPSWISKSGPIVTSTTVRPRDSISQSNGDSSSVKSSNALTTQIIQSKFRPISQRNGDSSILFNARNAQIIEPNSAPLPTANRELSSIITTDEANQRKKLAEMWHSDIPADINHQLTDSIGEKFARITVTSPKDVTSRGIKNGDISPVQIIEIPDIGPSETKQDSDFVFGSTSRILSTNSDETTEPNELARKGLYGILDKITTKNSCELLTDSVGKRANELKFPKKK